MRYTISDLFRKKSFMDRMGYKILFTLDNNGLLTIKEIIRIINHDSERDYYQQIIYSYMRKLIDMGIVERLQLPNGIIYYAIDYIGFSNWYNGGE